MEQVAEVRGGKVNVVVFAAYYRVPLDRPLQDWTADELKEFLGEPD